MVRADRHAGGGGCQRRARRTPGSARPAWLSTTCRICAWFP